jgi:hypothetical protein
LEEVDWITWARVSHAHLEDKCSRQRTCRNRNKNRRKATWLEHREHRVVGERKR